MTKIWTGSLLFLAWMFFCAWLVFVCREKNVHPLCDFCPCPDHWTNYVGVAYKSYRLRLIDSNGMNFSKTETSCDVNLAGVYPSSAVGDATLAFSRNGEIYQQHNKTVLGVAIKGQEDDLAPYNALNPDFGYPMTVCTNLWGAPLLRLATNVKLPNGKVHLELSDATGQFTFWYYDKTTWRYRKLLDTDTVHVKDLSMEYWKVLMRRAADEGTSELPIRVTSSEPGHVSLIFRYWNVIDGKFVEDQAVQRITSDNPPLLADADGDWSLGEGDVAAHLAGRTFRFWTNEDCHKGDYMGQSSDLESNASDYVVNGRLDLVNLFPVKLDLKPFIDAWGSAARFVLRSPSSDGLRFCGVNTQPEEAWAYQTNDVYTTSGDSVCAAELTSIGSDGVDIVPGDYLGVGNSPGVLAFEAASEICCSDALTLSVVVGDKTLFSYSLPLSISSVRSMYRWLNIRNAAGGAGGEASSLGIPWNRPDAECDGRHFVFVHGYNVSPAAAREWANAMFKRLWLSGSRSMFTAVDWYGDDSQTWEGVPLIGGESLDYYINVRHAFDTAPNFSVAANALPGNKVMLAHSLGNMLVSEAAKCHLLDYQKYYMLNAAVPMEAYYSDANASEMEEHGWRDVDPSKWAANWYEHIPYSGDPRQTLKWRGRFVGMHDVINCYSVTEDILANATMNGWGGLWGAQELFKGTSTLHFIPGNCEGGWGYNNEHTNLAGLLTEFAKTNEFTDVELIASPIFREFDNSILHQTNLIVIAQTELNKVMGDGIPATSFAAGRNPIGSAISEDYNYQGRTRPNGWPRRENEWLHSDILKVAYFYIYDFFDKLTRQEEEIR